MDILRVDPADQTQVRACHEIEVAAHEADCPEMPHMSFPVFAAMITSGWIGDPREMWLAADGSGYCGLELPERENRHLAMLDLTVRPDLRRRGAGTALFNFITKRAVELGRSALSTEAWEGSGGMEFARYVRFKPGIAEVRRVLRVGAPGAGGSAPAVATPGYSMVSWTGATPGAKLEQVAAVMAMLEDAPRDASMEAERWDSERVRLTDRRAAAQRLRYYSVAAVKGEWRGTGRWEGGGELAALSQLGVDPERPNWGWQELTAVARAHRGHRLGMAVKVAMLDLLSRAEPQLEWILTWNAEENSHMIAINEALGFKVLGEPRRSWEREI
jgi:GNAT superfamily N-acetyltransferase